ncbi:hypothetical protein JB92DRAFT_889888 [Gautieria morchelliformis]|nr:hypothetical protein JB92DRAFT_889888 [Gautieria morchelliformis]
MISGLPSQAKLRLGLFGVVHNMTASACHHGTPPMPDYLYFYDLPGLSTVRQSFVGVLCLWVTRYHRERELVRNLAKMYISRPSCLILLVISCETDFKSQGACRLALESDIDGQRIVDALNG